MKVSLTCLLAILACFLRSADIPLSGSWTVSLPDGTEAPVTLPGTLEAQGIGTTAQGPRNNPPNAGTQGDHGLLLERVMWKSSVSIDGVLSTCDALSAPHLYTVPARLLTPGTHALTVEVDNRQIINIGEDGHCHGDPMQFRWHGILGTLALRPATPLPSRTDLCAIWQQGTVFPRLWGHLPCPGTHATLSLSSRTTSVTEIYPVTTRFRI